jgi:hypothetical protein
LSIAVQKEKQKAADKSGLDPLAIAAFFSPTYNKSRRSHLSAANPAQALDLIVLYPSFSRLRSSAACSRSGKDGGISTHILNVQLL